MNNKIKDKLEKISSKSLNIFNILRLYNIFMKIPKEDSIEYIKIFIDSYYCIDEALSDKFYELIRNKLYSDNDYKYLFDVISDKNIYLLISYLKNNNESINVIDNYLTPSQYFDVPKKYINRIIELLMMLEINNNNVYMDEKLTDNFTWLLKRTPTLSEDEYLEVAYKIYLSIGYDNAIELLSGKYGNVDYEKIYYMFSKLNVKQGLSSDLLEVFNEFIFEDKKDLNNNIRQMLNGRFSELFIDFDYFYNNFNMFVDRLGITMNKNKVKSLLEERYLSNNPILPEITGDISLDMISSYHHKYEFLDETDIKILKKNYSVYKEFLKNKFESSIPRIEILSNSDLSCEVLKLNDPRNLVMGYRSGNCFRINGDAQVLFKQFLASSHMRLISISSKEHKDIAMMLVMRNGNVLVSQGIEISNRDIGKISKKYIYDVCREAMKQLMNYMNSNGDEIVATVIGSSNSNVSDYNNQILPFIINPILDNVNNYYNGIDNYQCLLDLYQDKEIGDIKLYKPDIRYLDEREPIFKREVSDFNDVDNYRKVERRLIVLRFQKFLHDYQLNYNWLLEKQEICTYCNTDWFITLFDDGEINSFISSKDKRANEEYNQNLELIKGYNDFIHSVYGKNLEKIKRNVKTRKK